MNRKISIALESPVVALWFYNALLKYENKNGVAISLYLSGRKKGKSFLARFFALTNFWVYKKFPFFKPVRIDEHIKVEPLQPDVPVLGAVTPETARNIVQVSGVEQCCFIGPRGDRLTKPGFQGLWYFYLYFFSLANPLMLWNGRDEKSRQVYFQTRNFSFRKNAGFLRYNLEKILDRLLSTEPVKSSDVEMVEERNGKFFLFIKFQFWQLSQKFKENMLKPRWQLMKMDAKSINTLKVKDVEFIKPPAALAWADPMLVDTPTGLFLFLEEVQAGKGHLSVTELHRDSLQMKSPPVAVLKHATHLSYPFVFNVEDDWYMLPESSAAAEVCIYKADRFPLKWSLFRRVFNLEKWVDLTPFYYQQMWWIFGVKKETSYASSYQDLHIFYCRDLLRDHWVAHPQNPVVSDVRHARPAGPLFFWEGKLLRPAQNCLNSYGGGLVLCEVTRLSQTQYAEQVRGEFDFPGGSKVSSFHTLSVYDQLIMGDCFI